MWNTVFCAQKYCLLLSFGGTQFCSRWNARIVLILMENTRKELPIPLLSLTLPFCCTIYSYVLQRLSVGVASWTLPQLNKIVKYFKSAKPSRSQWISVPLYFPRPALFISLSQTRTSNLLPECYHHHHRRDPELMSIGITPLTSEELCQFVPAEDLALNSRDIFRFQVVLLQISWLKYTLKKAVLHLSLFMQCWRSQSVDPNDGEYWLCYIRTMVSRVTNNHQLK